MYTVSSCDYHETESVLKMLFFPDSVLSNKDRHLVLDNWKKMLQAFLNLVWYCTATVCV